MALTYTATNFIFDNVNLKHQYDNVVIGEIGSSGVSNSSNTSELNITTAKGSGSDISNIMVEEFSDSLEFTFQIFKLDEFGFSATEIGDITRWFIRRDGSYHPFQLCDDIHSNITYYCKGTKVETIYIGAKAVGFSITLKSNSPYAYGNIEEINLKINSVNPTTEIIIDNNKIVGEYYPDIEIKFLSSGNLTIYNELTNKTFTLNNNTQDEIIEINGFTKEMTSSIRNCSQLYNDFGYVWFSMGNTFKNKKNLITFTGCMLEIKITSRPLRTIGL